MFSLKILGAAGAWRCVHAAYGNSQSLFSHIIPKGMRHLLPAVFICFMGACMPLVSQCCAGMVCAVLCVISPYSHLVMVLGGDSRLKWTRFWFAAQLVRTVDQLSYRFSLTLEIDSYITWLFTCRYLEAQFPYLFVSLPTCILLTESISLCACGGSAQAVCAQMFVQRVTRCEALFAYMSLKEDR